jgi:hypothetical protein
MKQKVVLLKELHRAIIYTTEISKQVTKSHVRMQFTVYLRTKVPGSQVPYAESVNGEPSSI